MKRFCIVLFAFIVAVAAIPTSVGAEGTAYHYEVGGQEYTVIFEDESLSAEERDAIVHCLLGAEDEQAATYNVWCHFFGHLYGDATQVTVIEHKVNSYEPRCERKTYDVQTCERCGEQAQTLVSTVSIFCCAPD